MNDFVNIYSMYVLCTLCNINIYSHFRLYVVFEQGAAFVLSLPDLQLLRRTAIHSTGRRLGESIVPQGPHRALAVRCQQRRRLLHFYELPALALRRTLKLDDQVWFYKVWFKVLHCTT